MALLKADADFDYTSSSESKPEDTNEPFTYAETGVANPQEPVPSLSVSV